MSPQTQTSPERPALLFTGFEPSGDDHAASVIAELKRRHPDLEIYAWGGPKMEKAGAVIVQRTGENAVIGMPGVKKILEHRKINRSIAKWLRTGPLAGRRGCVHVPVDSPAANFPICAMTKRAGMKVVHLVAPQVWAWASWRVHKLRRLTDLVLCLLPFEEEWFQSRAVPARFVGHPLFDEPVDLEALAPRAARIPGGAPKLALMPGSRPAEMSGCFPVLLDAFARIRAVYPDAAGVVAATKPETAQYLREIASELGGWPAGLHMVASDTDAAIAWCDFALVVSGTVTLQITRQVKPMVALYRPTKLLYYSVGFWLVRPPHFTLPNLVAGRRIVPEFIPHFGDGEPLALEIIKLLRRDGYADDQRENLAAVVRRFRGKNAAVESADALERVLGLRPPEPTRSGVAPLEAARS